MTKLLNPDVVAMLHAPDDEDAARQLRAIELIFEELELSDASIREWMTWQEVIIRICNILHRDPPPHIGMLR